MREIQHNIGENDATYEQKSKRAKIHDIMETPHSASASVKIDGEGASDYLTQNPNPNPNPNPDPDPNADPNPT